MLRLFAAVLILLNIASIPAAAANIRHVFVVVMENKDAYRKNVLSRAYVYGNERQAPYINKELMPQAAHASQFIDELPDLNSEPHYVLMEAGTNEFPDASFTCDADPLKHCSKERPQNWTASRNHLVTQLETAGFSWMAYVEGLKDKTTGACPIRSAGQYAAKHVPFVFFSDVAGSPPIRENADCARHFRNVDDLTADLARGDVANYVFIVPDLCNDMHGGSGCEEGQSIRQGDQFLASLMPKLLKWSAANQGVVMVAWDEGHDTDVIPFIMAGTGVKKNFESKVRYSHRSIIRTVEQIFGLPALETVKDAPDFADMVEPGTYP